ncbi:MAG TPA: hypothetical protein VF092_08135 [Longimicrobium sp.]
MTPLRIRRRISLHLTAPVVLALTAAACGGDAKETRALGEQARATAVAAPATASSAAASNPDSTGAEVVTIRGLTGGDRACYVDLEGTGVARSPQEAAFAVCERKELVGRRVRLSRMRTWVLAASCEGDPECARRDTVDLIVSAEPVPEGAAPASAPGNR